MSTNYNFLPLVFEVIGSIDEYDQKIQTFNVHNVENEMDFNIKSSCVRYKNKIFLNFMEGEKGNRIHQL